MVLRRVTTLVALVACGFMQAQTNADKGNIGGWISNGDHQPIAHAKVIVTNEGTGLQRQTLTNDSGLYEFETLDPGTYDVRVEAVGATLR